MAGACLAACKAAVFNQSIDALFMHARWSTEVLYLLKQQSQRALSLARELAEAVCAVAGKESHWPGRVMGACASQGSCCQCFPRARLAMEQDPPATGTHSCQMLARKVAHKRRLAVCQNHVQKHFCIECGC